MLGTSKVHPILLSRDLDQTREFYHDRLGLEILITVAAFLFVAVPALYYLYVSFTQ